MNASRAPLSDPHCRPAPPPPHGYANSADYFVDLERRARHGIRFVGASILGFLVGVALLALAWAVYCDVQDHKAGVSSYRAWK